MKFASHLLLVSTLFAGSALAAEKMSIEHSSMPAFISAGPEMMNDYQNVATSFNTNEADQTILTLKKTILDQRNRYESRISYLENELKKSHLTILEKTKKFETAKLDQEKKHKRETIAQAKELMKYQRELEKVKPDRMVKEQLMAQADIALQLRKTQEQTAMNSKEPYAVLDQYKTFEEVKDTPRRLPASVEK